MEGGAGGDAAVCEGAVRIAERGRAVPECGVRVVVEAERGANRALDIADEGSVMCGDHQYVAVCPWLWRELLRCLHASNLDLVIEISIRLRNRLKTRDYHRPGIT